MDSAIRLRVSGICGIAAPILIVALFSAAILTAGLFSWSHNTLSDLGTQYPSAYFFNGSLMAAGMLMMVFGRGIPSLLQERRAPRLGSSLLLLGGLSLLLVGVFTSSSGLIHSIFTVLFFSFTALAMVVIGLSELSSDKRKGSIAIILGACVALMFIIPFPIGGFALREALSILFAMAFSLIYGARLTRLSKRI